MLVKRYYSLSNIEYFDIITLASFRAFANGYRSGPYVSRYNRTWKFSGSAGQLHLTQSTVSARIQRLEEELGARLFVRNRSGASLTTAGRRFLEHAKRLVLTEEQARHEVGLPSRYRATIRIGGRIALWDEFLPRWVGWMRRVAKDIAIRSEIGFEEDLMRGLIEGMLDIGLMYTPESQPRPDRGTSLRRNTGAGQQSAGRHRAGGRLCLC